jgi:hypothetical protein
MALYIAIRKDREDDHEAEYSYGVNEASFGTFVLNKKTGTTTLTKASASEPADLSYYERAAFKIRKFWTSGELPDETCWAS